MRTDYEHIWARTLPEAHHRALCKLHHLANFLGDVKGRRAVYFEAVAQAHATLKNVTKLEPQDQDVVHMIEVVLGKDRTFLPFVSKHGGAELALDPAKWRLVLEAGAGTIVGTYLIALENGNVT
jgi:hypothetical protein